MAHVNSSRSVTRSSEICQTSSNLIQSTSWNRIFFWISIMFSFSLRLWMRWLYLLQDVTDAPGPSDLSSTLVKQDDNTIIHVMSNITSKFHLIAHRIFDSIPRCGDFIFRIDMYKEGSIKEMERQMRGTSDYIIVLKSKRHSHCLYAQEQGILIQFALAVLTRRFLIVIHIANHNG